MWQNKVYLNQIYPSKEKNNERTYVSELKSLYFVKILVLDYILKSLTDFLS